MDEIQEMINKLVKGPAYVLVRLSEAIDVEFQRRNAVAQDAADEIDAARLFPKTGRD